VEWEAGEHERGLALFMEKRYRPRFLGLVEAGRRDRLRQDLPHFPHLDDRFVLRVPAAEQNAEAIASVLKRLGSPDRCLVVSEASDIDGVSFPLKEALNRVVGAGFGSFISCVPGELAFFEGEGPNNRCVLRRART
jgi:hypothetical protein